LIFNCKNYFYSVKPPFDSPDFAADTLSYKLHASLKSIPVQFSFNPISVRHFLLFAVLSQLSMVAMGQSIFTATINTSGESKQLSASDPLFPGFLFEWSVGESAAITTMGEANLMVTNGLLQYRPQMQTTSTSLVASYTADDIRVYPNPVKNNLSIGIMDN
jgi:hypothetical protein